MPRPSRRCSTEDALRRIYTSCEKKWEEGKRMRLALPKATSSDRRSPNCTSKAAEVYCNSILFESADK